MAPLVRMTSHQTTIASPLGPIRIRASGDAITHLDWGATDDAPATAQTPLLEDAAAQLNAYFDGKLQTFDLPLAPRGDAFQQSVLDQMNRIPYGQTLTYGDIAKALGTYGQPVGQACGANTIPIIIPCHRVLSATGLGGYSGDGGVETKIWLLRHEGGFPFLL